MAQFYINDRPFVQHAKDSSGPDAGKIAAVPVPEAGLQPGNTEHFIC